VIPHGVFEARFSWISTDFQAFLPNFAATYLAAFHMIVLDNVRSHHAAPLQLPDSVVLLSYPCATR
jgi:hypothetical protein